MLLLSKIRLYGRRQGRALKPLHHHLLDVVFPKYQLSLTDQSVDDFLKSTVKNQELSLEVGFGGGEHLAAQALLFPHRFFIGCEPFINGLISLVQQIEEKNIENVKVIQGDARILMTKLSDHSLKSAYILFPDPWPKKRHFKRRLIQAEVLSELWRALEDNGRIYIATDHACYLSWILDKFAADERWQLELEGRSNIYERPAVETWPMTRYEQKSGERQPAFLVYRKK